MATEFTLRSFLADVERQDAREMLRIRERVGLDYDVTAVALELERQGRAPVLWFDDVGGSPFPVVTNVFGARRRYAAALGVAPEKLIEEWGVRGDKRIAPVAQASGPVQDVV